MPDFPQVTTSAPEARVSMDEAALGYLFDTARFEHMQRIATAMARASLTPEHLKPRNGNFAESVANCFVVVSQAMRWQMDPFAMAPETYSIGCRLAYKGKLVAAVINARAGLAGRLDYSFNDATGDDLTITVAGTFKGENQPRTVTVRVGDAKTDNEMWVRDPHQKLVYSGAIKWARRWCPEIVLGVLTDDDLERIVEDQQRARRAPSPEPAVAFDSDCFEAGLLSLIGQARDLPDVERILAENAEDMRRLSSAREHAVMERVRARRAELAPSHEARTEPAEPLQPAQASDNPPSAAETSDLAQRKPWGKLAGEIIDHLAGSTSEADLESRLTSRRCAALSLMKTAAPAQYRAVTAFIEGTREQTGLRRRLREREAS